jgi:hypothetical protein
VKSNADHTCRIGFSTISFLLVSLGLGCDRKAEPQRNITAVRSSAPAATPSITPSATSVLSQNGANELVAVGCEYRIVASEFSDCNPRPSQKDYPECYRYKISPISEGDSGDPCLPAYATVTISGWPSILDSVRARVVRTARRRNEFELSLDRIESSIIRDALGPTGKFTFPERPGALLGTLLFKDGKSYRFRRSPRLAHCTLGQRSS